MQLTDMQKRYIWLAGSFPKFVLIQGQGKRTKATLYKLRRDDEELIVFGYGDPVYFLKNRGLLRAGQAPHSYHLTEAGFEEFQRLLVSGTGLKINDQIRETR